jgi:hypothetical protein
MDFANRGNRPVQNGQQPAANQQNAGEPDRSPAKEAPQKKMGGGKFDFGKLSSIVMLFGVVILSAALIIAIAVGGKGDVNKESELIKTDKYQALFLDSPDGQVYFGKLQVYNTEKYALTDIFYVRVENPIQPEGANQPSQPNISLAKLGNELHGPEDVMFISRDKVLYWENLKDDGQVVTAITEFKANGGETSEQQQVPAAGTQPAGTPQQNDTPTPDASTPVAAPPETQNQP